MTSHMVVDYRGFPVHCNNPAAVKRWLGQQVKLRPEAREYFVRVWKDGKFVFLDSYEYLGVSGPREDEDG